MPRKNINKKFVPNAYYHAYNRGNNKQIIFYNQQDYRVFRSISRDILRKNPDISLKVFALMKTHFHFLLHQKNSSDLTKFMRSLVTRYVMYFNKKYQRVGSLFSGVYRAKLLQDQRAIKETEAYILSNPLNAGYENWRHVGSTI